MTRGTISLEDLAAVLDREARRRGVSASQVLRETVEAGLGRTVEGRRQLAFAALGRSGQRSTARDLEKILTNEWALDRDR